ILAAWSLGKAEVGEIQGRPGLDLKLRIERDPVIASHDLYRRIHINRHRTGHLDRHGKLELLAGGHLATLPADPDAEGLPPLAIILDQHRRGLRKLNGKLQAIPAGADFANPSAEQVHLVHLRGEGAGAVAGRPPATDDGTGGK